MVLNMNPDVEMLYPKEKKKKTTKKPPSPRKLRMMNACAILVVITLLLLIVLKVVFGLHPGIFSRAFCGTGLRNFTVSNTTFLKDGKPFKYISGSIHYSRVPAVYWRDRLHKMRVAGLDAVQVYVPWNFHQPKGPDQSLWTGDHDLIQFLKLAQAEDLLVILRAGPYICAEWDFGGLPGWLLQKNASMIIRSSDPSYMRWVEAWMVELLTKVKPLLYSAGGPIIMVQLENEYGSYPTCDKKYVSSLYDLGRLILGNDIVLFTTDGNSANFLRCGALDRRFFATVDFGTGAATNPAAAFAALRKIQPTGPLVNSEYYVGWLDTWGSGHAHVSVPDVLRGFKAMYEYNVSINMYMFFGGTNFGYWNGAEDPKYVPQVTSYDYDAPLSEAGDMTWKFQALQRSICTIKNNCGPPATPSPSNATILPTGFVQMAPLCHFTSLLPAYPTTSSAGQPLATMESHGVFQGYAVYSAFIGRTDGVANLTLPKVRDAAYVFTTDKTYRNVTYQGSVYRDGPSTQVLVRTTVSNGDFLHILIENRGHINFGAAMQDDVKGLFGTVSLDKLVIKTWHFFELDLTKNFDKLAACDANGRPPQGMFFSAEGHFEIATGPDDAYLKPTSFLKGQLLLNKGSDGNLMNVGRYWPLIGPQQTLYVPRTFFRKGVNTLVLFEVGGVIGTCPGDCRIDFVEKAQLGRPEISSFTSKRFCRGDHCPF